MKTYAAIYKNKRIRENSSSGGIFSALANKFDVVYGVTMTDDCYSAEMIRAEGDITSLRGSKYFQAKVGDTFKQVKKDLLDGKKVLFSGTGCQINGLSMFLGKEYPNLFLLDIICHGTPSSKLWREYTKYQEGKYGKLENVIFRCKDDSWIDFGMKENQLYISKDKDSFMQMFLNNYCLRPACYECHAKYYKKSDMTIADFWGIENVAPEMNDGRGTSLVITRTDKGQELFDSIKSKLKWKEVSYEAGVRGNPSEYSSVSRPQRRDTFFGDLEKMPFEKMEKKYAAGIKVSLPRRVVRKIKRTIKKILWGTQKLTPMPSTVSSSHSRSNDDYGILLIFKK
ncbi:MAG: Coenzyme F420 hydrogenase/dehydrogenase, beta subunit C-terminal domain [Lachnospiraceae bacterium]|nr:Coenzyme F420 hydrogenase/dehydrogenase, beta subunit C-terminal domain [Lachnospiraceae bacterium]